MRIHLSNAGAVRLNDPADFRRLDVLVDPQSSDMLERAIQRLGCREDAQHIRVSPSVLRFLSGLGGQPEWEAGFAHMLAYARQQVLAVVDQKTLREGDTDAQVTSGSDGYPASLLEIKYDKK